MSAAAVECPACGEALAVDAGQGGVALRCGACRTAFRVPPNLPGDAQFFTGTAWRRVYAGLGTTYYAGAGLLLIILVLALMQMAVLLTAGPEFWQLADADEMPVASILVTLGTCGLTGLAALVLFVALMGMTATMAVPAETRARGCLAAALAASFVAAIHWLIVFALAIVMLADRPSDEIMNLVAVVFLAAGMLTLIAAICHTGFLRGLAAYLGDAGAASGAAALGTTLAVGAPLAVCGFCAIGYLGTDTRQTMSVLQVTGLMLVGLVLGWWLSLVHRVRAALARRRAPALTGRAAAL